MSEKNALKQIIELKITIDQNYTPGTAIVLYPQNQKEKVDRLIGYVGLSPSLEVKASDIPKSISHRCSTQILLSDYFVKFVDISSGLKTLTASYLAGLLQNNEEKEDLLSCIDSSKISMPAAYNLECILSQYKSWRNIEIKPFLESLPVLSGRNYSISCSPVISPTAITIVFTVEGLCTRYLNNISSFPTHVVEYSLPVGLGTFWEGISNAEKVLIVCNGTGISPFKGILEHLTATQKKPVWLLYGCRNSILNTPEQNYDHIYQEEVSQFLKACGGKLSVANSRSPVGPKYVQDIIDEQSALIAQWSSVALLCGSFKSVEISGKLKALNPNFQIFTEEWD